MASLKTPEQISLSFDPPAHQFVKPGRVLVREGFLQRQGRWSVVDRWCFLFSDGLFIIANPNRTRTVFELKQTIDLHGATIDLRRIDAKVRSCVGLFACRGTGHHLALGHGRVCRSGTSCMFDF